MPIRIQSFEGRHAVHSKLTVALVALHSFVFHWLLCRVAMAALAAGHLARAVNRVRQAPGVSNQVAPFARCFSSGATLNAENADHVASGMALRAVEPSSGPPLPLPIRGGRKLYMWSQHELDQLRVLKTGSSKLSYRKMEEQRLFPLPDGTCRSCMSIRHKWREISSGVAYRKKGKRSVVTSVAQGAEAQPQQQTARRRISFEKELPGAATSSESAPVIAPTTVSNSSERIRFACINGWSWTQEEEERLYRLKMETDLTYEQMERLFPLGSDGKRCRTASAIESRWTSHRWANVRALWWAAQEKARADFGRRQASLSPSSATTNTTGLAGAHSSTPPKKKKPSMRGRASKQLVALISSIKWDSLGANGYPALAEVQRVRVPLAVTAASPATAAVSSASDASGKVDALSEQRVTPR